MSTPRIGIVDYGMGNRRSVEKAFARVGADPVISSDPGALRETDGLVVPGVGAFPQAMANLRASGLDSVIREAAEKDVPLLGLCLGMQLLFETSVEIGGAEGLGLLPGRVVDLDAGDRKLPNIGWAEVTWTKASVLTDGLPATCAFYHVHSYVAEPAESADVLGRSEYATPFVTAVESGRVYGVQFHPEKSSTHGLALLGNFVSVCAGESAQLAA